MANVFATNEKKKENLISDKRHNSAVNILPPPLSIRRWFEIVESTDIYFISINPIWEFNVVRIKSIFRIDKTMYSWLLCASFNRYLQSINKFAGRPMITDFELVVRFGFSSYKIAKQFIRIHAHTLGRKKEKVLKKSSTWPFLMNNNRSTKIELRI